MIELAVLASPVGPLAIAVNSGRVCRVWFGVEDDLRRAIARWYPGQSIVEANDPAGAVTALDAYFAGALDTLDTLEIELHGTPFQLRVWNRLRHVHAGTTASYQEVALAIGAPSAVRAVGAANGANPIPIIVPCHRIIGSNGSLTGYGGGLDRKRWLLAHEGLSLKFDN
jgi:methylated-DNA-[protein]-cysteine S-methyltransferase